jgi:hypothetical protein
MLTRILAFACGYDRLLALRFLGWSFEQFKPSNFGDNFVSEAMGRLEPVQIPIFS